MSASIPPPTHTPPPAPMTKTQGTQTDRTDLPAHLLPQPSADPALSHPSISITPPPAEAADLNLVAHGSSRSPLLPPNRLTLERIFSSPSLNGPTVRGLKFSPDGQRATYLQGKPEKAEQLDLLEYHVPSGEKRLLVDSALLMQSPKELSAEEQAHREALRLFADGIVDYHWFPNSETLLFPLGDTIYLYHLTAKAESNLSPLIKEEDGFLDLKISPAGSFISFVQKQNIHAARVDTGEKTVLTRDGVGSIKNGMAEFVAQEEMDRYTAYWWSPDEQKIAYLQTDDKETRHEKGGYCEEPYPFAGTPNVDWRLGVAPLDSSKKQEWLALPRDPEDYLLRLTWHPTTHTNLVLQLLSRDHKDLRLMEVNSESGECRTLITDRDENWINAHDDDYHLKDGSGLIWSSESTGFRHLYLHGRDGELIRPITEGEWVVKSLVGVDEAKRIVYFEGFLEGVLNKHLYALSYAGETLSPPQRITQEEGWHSATLSPDKQTFIHHYQSQTTPPQNALRGVKGTLIQFLEENCLEEGHPYFPYSQQQPIKEFGTLSTPEGVSLHYSLLKPHDFDPLKEYPTLIYVYGGPNTRLVTNIWERTHWKQFMVNRGYLLFTLDNRGSYDRGKEFEAAIKGNMGSVDFLQSLPHVRDVGVFGWSYGGYMTLKMMSKEPERFPTGVSVAPVTDWQLYDTFYTERYMGFPQENAAGYETSRVAHDLDGLQGQLLLAHGLSNNNVLAKNSFTLAEELQERDISFERMTYLSQRHSISARRTHLFRMVTRFFDKNLLG